MLPKQLRTAKIQERLIDPQGINRWKAARLARFVHQRIARWLDGKNTVELDDLDCLIIRWMCQHLGIGSGINFNPFRGGAALCGNTMIESVPYLKSRLAIR